MSVRSSEFEVGANHGRRPVWVVNDYHEPYTEEFRGKVVTVPPNGEKSLKMPFLEARRFLGQPIAPPESLPNGQFKKQPKMLKTVEMSDEELKATGFNSVKVKTELLCPLCSYEGKDVRGLTIHLGKQHGDHQRAPSE